MTDEQVVMIFLEETGFTIGHVVNLLTRISVSEKLEAMNANS